VKESEESQVIEDEVWQKTEDEIFDSRNYHLKSVTFNFEESSQLSVAISKLQGMIGALRVRLILFIERFNWFLMD
jgi:hypothetical protein